MAIPDYQTAMLPLLRLAADGDEHRFRDSVERLAIEFQLTDDERGEMLPSGTAPLFDNRVGWARTYLKQAGLLQSPKRGVLRITERGRALLATNPTAIGVADLDQYDEFRAFRSRRRDSQQERPPGQQQSAALGLSGVREVMGTVVRNIVGRMDDRQLLSVFGSIRQFKASSPCQASASAYPRREWYPTDRCSRTVDPTK